CGPCKMVMPYLQKIHDGHADEGIRVVALSVDQKSPSSVRQFLDKYGYTFPVAMAGVDLQSAYGGISSIPTTFIIGPDGAVKERMVGAHPLDDYLAAARRAKQAATGT
ncbi:TlpA family protein disulfide reductase, partial [bacterium]|nr:TlpA family protein disulfide reductase [bacterium]